ncbi:MAG: hypothetical protein RL150_31 [Candidatus Parcubacteria bacterium]|jgi:hypothetical protein
MKPIIYLFVFFSLTAACYAGGQEQSANTGALRKLGQKIFKPSLDNQARKSSVTTPVPGSTNGVCVKGRCTVETQVVRNYHTIKYVPEMIVKTVGDPNPQVTSEVVPVQGVHTIQYEKVEPEIIEEPMPEVEHTVETRVIRGTHTIKYVVAEPEIIEEPMPEVEHTVETRVVRGTHTIQYQEAAPVVLQPRPVPQRTSNCGCTSQYRMQSGVGFCADWSIIHAGEPGYRPDLAGTGCASNGVRFSYER